MDNPITPTVGRVVLFRQIGEADQVPALITRVWSNSCVNLQVLPDAAPGYFETSVAYWDGEYAGSARTWCWMPYQKAVASGAGAPNLHAVPDKAPGPQPTSAPVETYRELTEHKVNPANDLIKVSVLDPPGSGGAQHWYMVTLPEWTRSPDGSAAKGVWDIRFQNGPIAEAGVNGLTHEVLLAILADRLRAFQAGSFACHENGRALAAVEDAMRWLRERTRGREARGVEGTHKL
jgi:hypothetical protein